MKVDAERLAEAMRGWTDITIVSTDAGVRQRLNRIISDALATEGIQYSLWHETDGDIRLSVRNEDVTHPPIPETLKIQGV